MLDATGLIIITAATLLVIVTIRVYERLLADVRAERDQLELDLDDAIETLTVVLHADKAPKHPSLRVVR
ncbi:hypothetical protein UFOVP199_15 [uncultured Caudovirales phage]|uniref:Uncharacterized protein n=1 Tax=uncultured Caudovirales phage TaxID=2100421 RepID=A0A6J7WLM1_9CAUD|nr:hypothetical protein UFOVP199_15 [uncultured Caudovirales phage]